MRGALYPARAQETRSTKRSLLGPPSNFHDLSIDCRRGGRLFFANFRCRGRWPNKVMSVVTGSLAPAVAAICLAAVSEGAATLPGESSAVSYRLATLSAEGTPVYGQQLEWWRAGNEVNKHVLNCSRRACAEWTVQLPTSAKIRLLLSRVHEDDPQCWDWYAGELIIGDEPIGDVRNVRLAHAHTVCRQAE